MQKMNQKMIVQCLNINQIIKIRQKNRFELFNAQFLPDTDESHSDKENETSDQKDAKLIVENVSVLTINDCGKKKYKKKNKKSKKQQSQEKNYTKSKEEDIDATIKEICELDENPTTSSQPEICEATNNILTMEIYHLNPYNEMIRRFGAKVVREDQPKSRVQIRRLKPSMVPNKHAPLDTGISMVLVDTRDGVHYFNFEHNKEYQLNQNLFLACVEKSGDILSMLSLEPLNLDVLIQSTEILVMAEQPKMAAENIEMAIAICERSFHPQFSLTRGNCRLDYRRAENRSFFIALFKHQYFVGQQGCYRTALEICKLLLSLDPDGDPLALTLTLDYYALLSKQFEYLVNFYRELNSSRNLHLLPNFSFSIPLALFKLGTENSIEEYIDESTQLLQEAILRFPSMILQLLEKCSTKPDGRITQHPFLRTSQKKEPICLTYLIDLYISRCHYLWKDPTILLWFEECIHQALDKVDQDEKLAKESIKNRFVGVSPNILRHLILSQVKESIPDELHQGPIYSFDPIPPSDAITTYQVTPRQVIDQGVSLFQQLLRPFLPNNGQENGEEQANPHGFHHSFETMMDTIFNILNLPETREDEEEEE